MKKNVIGTDRLSIVGGSAVIHSRPDDLVSPHDRNSGEPIACGVIGRARP
jgi:Cu/Zn superoxide dismutase